MHVHFVCTGNVLRSMTAEHMLKDFLKKQNDKSITVSSSGIAPHTSPYPATLERLQYYGIDASMHRPQQTTQEVLKQQDLILTMNYHHQAYVQALGFSSILYHQFIHGEEKPVLDEAEYAKKYGTYGDLKQFLYALVDYFHEATPLLYKKIKKIQKEKHLS